MELDITPTPAQHHTSGKSSLVADENVVNNTSEVSDSARDPLVGNPVWEFNKYVIERLDYLSDAVSKCARFHDKDPSSLSAPTFGARESKPSDEQRS